MLSKEFITGGRAIFTVDNGKGEHYTFRVRKHKESMPFFVALLTGPNNLRDYTYIGVLNENTGEVRLTMRSRYREDTLAVKVVRWALAIIWGGHQLPEGYSIRHEGRCGCCGRTLTTPDSLTRGIGPECASRLGLLV